MTTNEDVSWLLLQMKNGTLPNCEHQHHSTNQSQMRPKSKVDELVDVDDQQVRDKTNYFHRLWNDGILGLLKNYKNFSHENGS